MPVVIDENKDPLYMGDGFKITLTRYSDPERLNLARNAAIYMGKQDRDNVRRPLNIIKAGHVPEIFRGEFAEFLFEGVSKEVYDHLITYTTRNMRATGGNRALASNDFHMPGDKIKDPERVKNNILKSMAAYENNIESGESKQVSRSSMPVAAKMNPFVYQYNFLTLGESLFKQRIWEKGAQGNTVKVVKGMYSLCRTMDEDLWDTFYDQKGAPALEWEAVRRKLNKKNLTVHQFLKDLNVMAVDPELDQNPNETVVDYLSKKYGGLKSMW